MVVLPSGSTHLWRLAGTIRLILGAKSPRRMRASPPPAYILTHQKRGGRKVNGESTSEEKAYSRGSICCKSWRGWVSLPAKSPASAQPWTREAEKVGRRCSSARRPSGRSIPASFSSPCLLRSTRRTLELRLSRQDQAHLTEKELPSPRREQRVQTIHSTASGLPIPPVPSPPAAISQPTTRPHLLNTRSPTASATQYAPSRLPKA